MGIRSALTTLFTLLLVFAALSLIMGTLLGQPVLLSYVETGSMQPTLDPGDGFIAIPAQVAGPVEKGDVVTFRAEELHGGGLTTHRVVGRTDRGYITQGDANSFTDQSGVEPPVKDAQVVAVTVQVGENVVVIPHFGTVATGSRDVLTAVQERLSTLVGSRALLGAQGIAHLFFAATMLVYLLDLFRKRGKKGRSRNRTRDTGVDVRLIAGGFAILLVLGATASMIAPAGTQQYGVVSAEFESDRLDVIPSGESKNRTYPVSNNGVRSSVGDCGSG
jgi:signal peptidase